MGQKDYKPVYLGVATFVAANTDGTVQVDFGQGQITCLMAGNIAPDPGTSVRAIRVGSTTVVIGPAVAKPRTGTITATAGSLLTVSTTLGSESLPYFVPYTGAVVPTVGDVVVIDRSSSAVGLVMGKLSTTPAQKQFDVPPPAVTHGQFTLDVAAQDSGTWYVPGAKYNTEDVWAVGTGNNIGAWFYGTSIADSFPHNGSITRVQLYMPEFENDFPGTTSKVGLHSLLTKSGAPSISSTYGVPAGRGWKDLTVAMGVALVHGASRGIGIDGSSSGLAKYTSHRNDALSGTLRIDYFT